MTRTPRPKALTEENNNVVHLRVSNHSVERFAGVTKLLDRTVFVGLLVLIVTTAIPYGTVDPWWDALFECMVFTLGALWIVEGLFSGTWRTNKLLVVVPLVLITGYVFLQTFQWPAGYLPKEGGLVAQNTLTIDRYQTHLTALKTLALTLFLALLLIHTSTAKRLRWVVRVVIGLGLASALFGIIRQLVQSPTSDSFVLPFLFPGVGYAQFIGINGFSYLMEISLALIAGLVLGGGVPRNRVLAYASFALIIWAALVMSNSRGGIVSIACQSVFILFVSLTWYSRRRSLQAKFPRSRIVTFLEESAVVRVLGIALIVASLIAAVLWLGGQRLASKMEEQNFSQNTINGETRQEIWHSTWQLIKQHPWKGVGFGNYFLAIPQYHVGSGKIRLEQAHNDYLELLASGGIPACALAAWFLLMVLWRARSSLRSTDVYRRAACLGALAAILDVSVHSLVDFGLQLTGIAVVFAASIAIVAVKTPNSEAKSVDEEGSKGSRALTGRPPAA